MTRWVLSPLRGEIKGLLAAVGPGEPLALPGAAEVFRCQGGATLVGWTGVGASAVRRTLEALSAAEPRPEWAALVGVAGALTLELEPGQVFRCPAAYADGERIAGPQVRLPDALAGLPAAEVASVSTVADGARKRALAQELPGATLVDMETAWAFQVAVELGLPLGAVRVVCDRRDQAIPDLGDGLDAVGRVRPLKFARQLLRNPSSAKALPGLGRAFAQATGALTPLLRAALAG
ncbi:MAG: hypothetical protein KDD82_17540 [Planctomycetes bacterium]|nr:hypothetical protein [Planctomycetota bacterium]